MLTDPSPPSGLAEWARRVGNLVNLSTPLGLVVAAAGRARVRSGPHGMWLADRYRLRFPIAGAFTVGDVLITGQEDWAAYAEEKPGVLAHEEKHTWQWLAIGPAFLPAYTVAMGWSWLRTGDRASANWFERRADLALGGYAMGRPRRSVRIGVVAAWDLAISSIRARTRAGGRTGRAGAPTGADATA